MLQCLLLVYVFWRWPLSLTYYSLYTHTSTYPGKELEVLSEGATRWTDNVFAVKKQCVRKYNMASKVSKTGPRDPSNHR